MRLTINNCNICHLATIILVVLCLLAFVLRIANLDTPDLWADEAWNVGVAVQEMASIPAIVAHDVYPPLYLFLMHVWVALTGGSAFAARFPSLFFSVLTVALTYRLGRRVSGASVGLLGAGIVALSHFDVYYAREAKDLTMVTFLGLLSLWFLVRALEERRMRDWAGYALAAAASLYTFYYAAFVLLAMNLAALAWLLWRARRDGLRWLLAQLGVGLLLLPWVLYAVPLLVARWGRLESGTQQPGLLFMFDVWAGAFVPGFGLGFQFRMPVLILCLLTIGLALLAGVRRPAGTKAVPPLHIATLLSITVLPTLLAVLATRAGGSFHARYLLPTFPAYALLLAWIIHLLARWHPTVAATAGVLLVTALAGTLPQAYPTSRDIPDFASAATGREIVAYLHARAGPTDLVLAEWPAWTGLLHSIYPGAPPACASLPDQRDETPLPGTMEALVAGHEQIWLLPLPGQDRLSSNDARAWLDTHTYCVEKTTFDDTVLHRYLTPSAEVIERKWTVQFGNALATTSYALDDRAARPGGSLGVRIGWEATDHVGRDVHLSLRLVGPDGQTVAQWDGRLADDQPPTSQWKAGTKAQGRYGLAIPPDVSPGEYAVVLLVYDRHTGQPLAVTDPATGHQADHAILHTIQVPPEVAR